MLSPPPVSLENSIEKMTETSDTLATSSSDVTIGTGETTEPKECDEEPESSTVQEIPHSGFRMPDNVVVRKGMLFLLKF